MNPILIKEIKEKDLIIKIQENLITTGWLKDKADGVVGSLTEKAWFDFKSAHWLKDPLVVGSSSLGILQEDVNDVKGLNHPVPLDNNRNIIKSGGIVLPSGLRVYNDTTIVKNIPLTWGEVTKNLSRIPEDSRIENNIIETAEIFGLIREKIDIPLTINSGYRPIKINRQVGGVSNSQHVQGLALDISCANLSNLLAATRSILKTRGSGGIGLGQRRGFIHFDIGRNRKSVIEFGY